MPEVI